MRLSRYMSFYVFLDRIFVGIFFAAIAIATVFFIFAVMTTVQRDDRFAEQDLYFALQEKDHVPYPDGDRIVSEKAKVSARLVRGVVEEGLSGLEGLEKLGKLYGLMDLDGSPDGLRFAAEHPQNIREVLQNPGKDFYVQMPSYGSRFLLGGFISFLVLAAFSSASYFLTTAIDSRYRDGVLSYPWRERWAYPALIIMFPYVIAEYALIIPYAVFAGYFFLIADALRAAGGGSAPGSPEISRPAQEIRTSSRYLEDTRKEEALWRIKLARENMEQNRENWTAARCDILSQKSGLEEEVGYARRVLSGLGEEVQDLQRKLTQKQRKLSEINEAISRGDAGRESSAEFDEILKIPHVAAVEVDGSKLRIYTDTVYIDRFPSRHEIGIFSITIDGEAWYEVENLCTTHLGGHAHPHGSGTKMCFGALAARIEDHFRAREYAHLVRLVVAALHSYDLRGGPMHLISGWKRVGPAKYNA